MAALTLALMAAGVATSGLRSAAEQLGPVGHLADQRAVATLTGRVLSEPRVMRQRFGQGSEVVVLVRVDRVQARGQQTTVSTTVLLRADAATWPAVRWRDRVEVAARLSPVEPGRRERAQGRVTGTPVRVAAARGVIAAAERVRQGLRTAVAGLPADARGLVPAMVIGDTSLTPQDLTVDMRTTGMTHLSAVSGSNVAIVLAMVMGVCRFGAVPRAVRPAVGLVAVALFVVLARPDPSVIRAAVMGGIGLLGLSASRRSMGMPALGTAVALLLLYDPWLARSYGFALSVLATLGLLVLAPPIGAAIDTRLPNRLGGLGVLVAIPVAAQLMCAPVVVLLQGEISVVAVLANLLAGPLVAPTTIAGVVAAAVGTIVPVLAVAAAWAAAAPAWLIAQIARVGADLPGATAPWPDGPAGAWSLAVVTLLLLVGGPRGWWAIRRHRRMVAGGVAFLLGLTWPAATPGWAPVGWRLVACDVGQGDALILATGPGRGILVDAGPDPDLVDGCLDRLGIVGLDAVVITHFHRDHVDGLPGVARGRDIGRILTTSTLSPSEGYDLVADWADRHAVSMDTLVLGQRVVVGDLEAQVWWPGGPIEAGSVPNNASVVLAVRSGDVDVLLTGDIEREAARAIELAIRRDPRMSERAAAFDAVKTPHHGSANLDRAFMARVSAPIALLSVGADNDYGHPAPEHLAMLTELGFEVHRTDLESDLALVVEPDGAVSVVARGH